MKVLITAGPTRERIDPVRYLTNDSSGKQGYAIAKSCVEKGWDVKLISGPVSIDIPNSVEFISVESAQQMYDACMNNIDVDIAICVAAVCDWRPKEVFNHKIKKTKEVEELQVSFIKNPDILHDISNHSNRPKLVVGFAAETENVIDNAKNKLINKGCDLIIANQVGISSSGFTSDNNKIHIVHKSGIESFPLMSKDSVANKVLSKVISIYS